MRFAITLATPMNQKVLMNRLGYHEQRGHEAAISYVRRFGGDGFPRFHLYVRYQPPQLECNLHLDQKRPSYQGSHMHAGEYEGAEVEGEARRIQNYCANL